ncbi:hypothetical protein N8I77_011359 [Diaporthe amygdali]|uniref:Uncharacterized protein n=1 Tax=Phomopsis amygdali TaxID=1214568 RepID=A0AAD9S5B5_PHOAM|nr:hypothetical protein N8I77_011359 [Diaporthe amygdali]
MPRDRRDELGEASRAGHGGAREGSYGQHEYDSHDARRRVGSRSRSPGRRPAAEDFYRERSPERHASHHDRHRRHRHRSRDVASESPVPGEDRKGHDRRHDHRRHHHHRSKHTATADLPSNARPLSYKHDLDAFTPLFAYYLDVQKNLDFYELDSQQARGRWKSFVNKWNRGELAEGWYDPEMFERITRDAPPAPARTASARQDDAPRGRGESEQGELEGSAPSHSPRAALPNDHGRRDLNNDDSDSDYGPPPPPGQSDPTAGGARKGPGIPTLSDLDLQREAAAEEREEQRNDLRQARKSDRAQQKERLDELVPRAEPGTRERMLEKKALVNDKMKGFREGGDAMEEVGDGDLMGGGDSIAEIKRAKAAMQRKKTERELRREAEARAREEERLERLREWKEREEEKLRGLKELARARFG